MTVTSLANKLTLIPFGEGGPGRARGQLVGSILLVGDASGGFVDMSFNVPGGVPFAAIFSSVLVSGVNHEIVATNHILTPNVTDQATGRLVTLRNSAQIGDTATEPFSFSTQAVAPFEGSQLVMWPRFVWRPEAGEASGSIRVQITPNVNLINYFFIVGALAFDPQDIKDGLVPPIVDQMAVPPPPVPGASP